ncbi:streptophobe family protein [Streptomyces zingiberis]|uniref:Integral membrane protein n=1 Tax=Streptomyces zingiberis TaxID=2053010 RepID=A0ABX1BY89_9ACTN|nr:streptophobe family protein [Streptomyces zingiberis]NJQ02078.1 hypothetical protein [Streptomyces zingiberis]
MPVPRKPDRRGDRTPGDPGRPRLGRRTWTDATLTAVAAVGWSFAAMTGTAALALRLLDADAVGSLGPMSAAAVVVAVGGRVVPAGNVGIFGLEGAEARAAVDLMPLGVALAGALPLAWVFLRSLRRADAPPRPAELAVRSGCVLALFLLVVAGLGWAGQSTVTFDGAELGLGRLAGDTTGSGLPEDIARLLPDGLGDLGGGLAGQLADLVRARASVGFRVDTGASLAGGAVWAAGVLLIALLASRRTPLPRGWEALDTVVRPAVSALVTVVLLAVVAALATAVWHAAGDPHPARVLGGALLGAPNGAWAGLLFGLFVPWWGWSEGPLGGLLPAPLDQVFTPAAQTVTLGDLAARDGRLWLLPAAAVLAVLVAGVLTAVRTPRPASGGTGAFTVRCAVPLSVATGLALALLAAVTEVSAGARLSVFGFDAFGASLGLVADGGLALLLGLAWGAAGGCAGALVAVAAGAAGRRAPAPPPGPRDGGPPSGHG